MCWWLCRGRCLQHSPSLLPSHRPTGVGARMLPVWLHAAAEGQQLRASDAEFERVVNMGVGPLDMGTEEQEVRLLQGSMLQMAGLMRTTGAGVSSLTAWQRVC